VRERER
jgi:hypothetical protein